MKLGELISIKTPDENNDAILGFSTAAHYATVFKKFYNMTPGEYLRIIK